MRQLLTLVNLFYHSSQGDDITIMTKIGFTYFL